MEAAVEPLEPIGKPTLKEESKLKRTIKAQSLADINIARSAAGLKPISQLPKLD